MLTDTQPIPEPVDLETLAVELAEGAAQRALAGRRGDMQVSAKSSATDLVTEVDRAVEQWLVTRVRRRRPHDAILGEEGGGRSGESGVRWLVDPIDGTINFVLGIPAYATSVAVEIDGAVVAGAVCNPALSETFHAHVGGGAWLGAVRLRGPRDVALDRAVIGTGFGYDAGMRARQGAVAARLLPRVGDIRRIGSAALDLCAVAAGRLDGYVEAGLNAWDYAAGALIAQEAGCVVSGPAGGAPSTRLVTATSSALAPKFAVLLAELGADSVASPERRDR